MTAVSDAVADWPRRRMLALVSLARRHGVGDGELLSGTGFSVADLSDPAAVLRREDEWPVLRSLLQRTDPGLPLALEAGLDFHLSSVPAWGQAMRTGRTLGDALTFSHDYARQVSSLVSVRARLDGDVVHARWTCPEAPPDVRAFVVERAMVQTAMTARELLGRPMPLLAVRASVPRPAHAPALEDFAGLRIEWDAPVTEVTAAIGVFAEPLPGADPGAHERAVAECRLMLHRHRARGAAAARVRSYLAGRHSTDVGVHEVAAALGVSERGLRRLLAAEGATFRALIADVRLDAACDLLRSGHSVDATSARLGYADPSAFSHAFKRWAGTSPEVWRRHA